MDCNFTEEVSLLVDGELAPHEAARLRAHVEGCAACQQAREAFLLFRQELRSYELAPDPRVQSRALAAILGSRESGGEDAAPARGIVSQLWGSLNEAFGAGRLRPAHVATLALLLAGAALGLLWLKGSHDSPGTRQPDGHAVAETNSPPVRAATGGGKRPENSDAVDGPAVYQAGTPGPPRRAGLRPNPRRRQENVQARRVGDRPERRRRVDLSPDLPPEVTRVEGPTALPSSASSVALYAAGGLRAAAAADPSPRIGRHAERVERLLRSFRNARLTEHDPTLNVADARRLSKRLLYNNIALRREAASAGDLPVEGLLNSVEPVLIDISNLPNDPSPDAVGSIKERIHRRQLVGALQARGMLASR